MQDFTLTITISPDGETVEGAITGIKGKRCSNIAALLDKVGEELEHCHTADYDEPEPVSVSSTSSQTLNLGGRKW